MEFSPVWWVGKQPEPVKDAVGVFKAVAVHYGRVAFGPQFAQKGRSK